MTIKKILTEPDPFLRQKSIKVDKVDSETRSLMDDMLETMYEGKGIGLAATQVAGRQVQSQRGGRQISRFGQELERSKFRAITLFHCDQLISLAYRRFQPQKAPSKIYAGTR